MRYQLSTVNRKDQLIVALRQACVLMLFFVFAAALQVAWDREILPRTMWTFGAACLLVLAFVIYEVRNRAATGYLEIAGGFITQRYNEVEKVIKLSEVSEAISVNVLGNKSIILKSAGTSWNLRYGLYSEDAMEAFQLALGARLRLGSMIDHIKSLIA